MASRKIKPFRYPKDLEIALDSYSKDISLEDFNKSNRVKSNFSTLAKKEQQLIKAKDLKASTPPQTKPSIFDSLKRFGSKIANSFEGKLEGTPSRFGSGIGSGLVAADIAQGIMNEEANQPWIQDNAKQLAMLQGGEYISPNTQGITEQLSNLVSDTSLFKPKGFDSYDPNAKTIQEIIKQYNSPSIQPGSYTPQSINMGNILGEVKPSDVYKSPEYSLTQNKVNSYDKVLPTQETLRQQPIENLLKTKTNILGEQIPMHLLPKGVGYVNGKLFDSTKDNIQGMFTGYSKERDAALDSYGKVDKNSEFYKRNKKAMENLQ